MPVHTLIVLGAPALLGDLLTSALAPATDLRLVLAPAAKDRERDAVLRALESEPTATIVTLGADGREGIAWRLTGSPLKPLSLDALLAAARQPRHCIRRSPS
jgi:hypothetical protein